MLIGTVQIAEFRFELLSNMTVVPQQYTLHCVSIGDGGYSIIILHGNDQQIYNGNCPNGVCVREQLHSSNNTYDNTVNIIWDTQTISSGQSFSQSVNGDQMYRCNVASNRDRTLTVKGKKTISYIIIFNIYFKLQDSLLLLLLKSTRQVLLSLSVGQLIQLMLMDM